jgi:hypothetical protein
MLSERRDGIKAVGVRPRTKRTTALSVAWRSVLLPARCFTRTISLGSHHLTSVDREDLKAVQDVTRRSTSAKS